MTPSLPPSQHRQRRSTGSQSMPKNGQQLRSPETSSAAPGRDAVPDPDHESLPASARRSPSPSPGNAEAARSSRARPKNRLPGAARRLEGGRAGIGHRIDGHAEAALEVRGALGRSPRVAFEAGDPRRLIARDRESLAREAPAPDGRGAAGQRGRSPA